MKWLKLLQVFFVLRKYERLSFLYLDLHPLKFGIPVTLAAAQKILLHSVCVILFLIINNNHHHHQLSSKFAPFSPRVFTISAAGFLLVGPPCCSWASLVRR
jgi:hypothetical protein